MIYRVSAGVRSGEVNIPASKSYAHRQLICAALSKHKSIVKCDGISEDIRATLNCLQGMGAIINIDGENIEIEPIWNKLKGVAKMPCNESGSTLRFLISVVAALPVDAQIVMAEGLAGRPIEELVKVLRLHGVEVVQKGTELLVYGTLQPGEYRIRGDISSQYISGLLMALPLLEGTSRLVIEGAIESKDYISITEAVLINSGIRFEKTGNEYIIPGNQEYCVEQVQTVEQDWSNAAFFLCMGALSDKGIKVCEMPMDSAQGDRKILDILKAFGAKVENEDKALYVKKGKLIGQTIDAALIPDLVPTIAAVAAVSDGKTEIVNAGRLRIKESDRLMTTTNMLKALGADIEELEDGLVIAGRERLQGGEIDAANDHRIAMAAAVAACGCSGEVIVKGAECVRKSYPDFWNHLEKLEVANG